MVKKKNNTVYKIKWKNFLLIVLSTTMMLAALIFGIMTFKDYRSTKEMIARFTSESEVKNIVDDEKTRTIRPDSTLSKFDAYWDYIKLGLIEVDMAGLKKINADTVGYIELKGTDFSYPVVQSDNTFYRTHTLDKSKNSFGWIYMDENSSLDELDTNTIIYGNKNYLGLLSAQLGQVMKDTWKDDNNNYLIKFYTNKYSTLWQIISIYNTKDDDHLKTDFESEKDIETYIDSMLKKTEIKFKGYAKTDDKLLTITTNSKGTNLVVQAKLIKIRTE